MATNRSDSGSSTLPSRKHSIRSYVSDLICNAPNEEEFDALKIIEDHPEIRKHRSLVLDLAYEEFCRKKESGDSVRQRSFAQRFPDYEESLMRVLQVHQYLEQVEQKKEKPKVDWPKPGDVFGGYRLVELIGRGSFAFVFIAEQLNVAERKVVLKVTRNALDEVATLGRLDHPNIVQIFTVESDIDGFTAICMPLISKVTLFDVIGELHGYGGQPQTANDFVEALQFCISERDAFVLDRKKLPFGKNDPFVDAVLNVGVDIAEALDYSHKQKFLHCDIKPTNILITPEGRSMLFDFNLSAKSNSKTGRIGGTLPFMPPEQLQALIDANYEFEATTAVDIYSFGVTIYQFLTGKLPFGDVPESSSQKEAAQLLLDRQKNTDVSFAGIRGVNQSLQKTIKQCLSLDPAKRPASAAELARALRGEQKTIPRTRRWMITHPIKALVACILLSTLIPASILGINYLNRLPKLAVLESIEKGKKAESEYNFKQAIDHFQSAVKRADFAPKLRYEALCRLAIVQTRDFDPLAGKNTLEQLVGDFPTEEISNRKLELAILACLEEVTREEYFRAQKALKFLEESENRTLNDFNNCLSVIIKYRLEKNHSCETLMSEFKKILDKQPNHFEANFNMFRIARNRDIRKDMLDVSHLHRCIEIRGDRPILLSFQFRNEITKINKGESTVEKFLRMVKRYSKCGGEKTVVKTAAMRFEREKDKKQFLEEIEKIKFSSRTPDLFALFGVANPINDISF